MPAVRFYFPAELREFRRLNSNPNKWVIYQPFAIRAAPIMSFYINRQPTTPEAFLKVAEGKPIFLKWHRSGRKSWSSKDHFISTVCRSVNMADREILVSPKVPEGETKYMIYFSYPLEKEREPIAKVVFIEKINKATSRSSGFTAFEMEPKIEKENIREIKVGYSRTPSGAHSCGYYLWFLPTTYVGRITAYYIHGSSRWCERYAYSVEIT